MFIHPGAKQAKAVDLHAALYHAVLTANGEHAASEASPVFRVLHDLRSSVHESPTSEQTLSSLKRYILALNHVLDVAKLSPSLSPPLVWISAFDVASDCTLADLRLDRQAALYNLAVCHASLAISVFRMRPPTDDDTPFRRAILLFKQAAGLFAAIAAHPCSASNGLTSDLHPLTLVALEKAMLANAQQVFLERNILTGTSSSFNARFALGVRDFYHAAEHSCADPELMGTVIVNALGRPCAALRSFFNARALDLLARAAQERSAVGEEIARIKATQAAVQEAQTIINTLEVNTLPYLSALKQDLSAKLSQLSRDLPKRLENAEDQNRRIYFESVPTSLPEVKGRQSVAPAPFKETIISEVIDETVVSFSGLPDGPAPELTAAAARYKDLAAEHVTARITQLNNATSELTLAISSVEVVLSTTERTLSDTGSQSSRSTPRPSNPVEDQKALDTVRAAQRRGGLRTLSDMQAQVYGLAGEAKKSLENVEKLLRDEEAQDRQLRLEIQVSRSPSSQIAQPYFVKLAKLRTNFERAANADMIVSRQADDNRAAMAKLDEVVVPAVLPEPPKPGSESDHRAGDLDSVTSQARPALREARALVSRKDSLATEFERRKIGEDHFRATASLAIGDELVDVDQTGAILRRAYNDLDSDADSLLGEIRAKEVELKGLKERAEAVANGTESETGDEYLRCMNDIYRHQAAASKLLELIGHLEQGLQFYSKELDNIKLLITDSEGFVKSRDMEFRELISRPPSGGASPAGGLYPGGTPNQPPHQYNPHNPHGGLRRS